MAMSMGIHRDPKMFPSLSPLQAEMRKRLWAATVELTVQFHLDSAIPFLLSTRDFDSPAPSNLNDEDIDRDTQNQPPLRDGMTNSSLQIQLFECLPLRLEVLRLLNSLEGELAYDEVLTLGSRLRTACRKIAALFHNASGAAAAGLTSFHQRFVDIIFHKYILQLYRPFMFKARENPSFYLARKVCLSLIHI